MFFKKSPTRLLPLVALFAATASTAQAQQASPKPADHSTQASIHTDQRLDVKLPAGHVVQLRFSANGAHLDLRDTQGRHLRRLAQDGRGVQTVMWYSQGSAHEQLWAIGAQPQQPVPPVKVQVLQTWPTSGPAPLPPDNTPMGPRLRALQQAVQQGQGTDGFWQQIQAEGTPLIEPWSDGQQLVTFLWRDQGNTNVRLFGSPSGEHNPLQKLPGTDVWWSSAVLDPRTRLSYALAPDVPQLQPAHANQQRRMILATLQRDPFNAHTFPTDAHQAADIYQGRSTVSLPDAPAQPWAQPRAHIPQGQLQRHTVHSKILGNRRDVWTYVPAGAKPQALLVLFDAHAFVSDVPTPRIVDNLIADGLLPPTAAVIVGNASPEARGVELPPNPKFAQFMSQELMPWVQQQGLGQMARHTVVAGSSFGGLASSYMGLTHPELFGHVLSMSGSYWWAPQGEQPGWMQRAWHSLPAPVPNVRFYIDAGRFETGRGGRNGIVETSRELTQILQARGLPVTQREFVSGHDYLQWQSSLACGLVALLAPQKMQDARMRTCDGVQE